MAGFEVIYERFVSLGITGNMWIDGSFLTTKIDPGDIDFVAMIPGHFYDDATGERREFLEWIINNDDEPKTDFLCHVDLGLIYPTDSPLHYLTTNTLNHWEKRRYGFSVATHEPKGIAVVAIAPNRAHDDAAPE